MDEMWALSQRVHLGCGAGVRVRKACLQLLQAQKKNLDFDFVIVFITPLNRDILRG
jgi:hypothetical protein